MAYDRETVYSALLARLQSTMNATSVPALPQPVTRRARDLSQIGPDEQPAVFLVAGDEQILPETKGQAAKRLFYAYVFIYVRTDDPAQAPTTIIFPLLQLLERAVSWTPGDQPTVPGGSTTLGTFGGVPLVSHCKLVKVEINDGLPSGEGTALCTLELLAFGDVPGGGG